MKKLAKLFAVALASVTISLGSLSAVEIKKIHFLIPGGAGGGWDGTARGTGEALTKAGLIDSATFENMSGGGGGKAIGYLIENSMSNHGTLMVNSTPIVIRSLTKVFPQNFRDLTLIAGTIGDYAALVVPANSPYKNFKDLVTAYKKNPEKVAIGGGSVPGSMDHLVPAMAFKAAGADPTKVKYIPFDGGGKAMAGLLSGEVDALSTGFSEAVSMANSGKVRIIAVTSEKRVDAAPNAPTLIEQGYNVTFVNWRGFFAAPDLPSNMRKAYIEVLGKMYKTPEWEKVRARNGWVNIYNPGDKFMVFLTEQEKVIGNLMRELGFL